MTPSTSTSKIKRTCATCAAYNPIPTGNEPVCFNLVSIVIHRVNEQGKPIVIRRQPDAAFCCDDHQTPAEEAQEAHDAEVAQHLEEATPEFMAAMSACLRLEESLGPDHPDTVRALQKAMLQAPPSMMEFVGREAQAMGLIPAAHGYSEDGEPVYRLEDVAAQLDISVEEAQEAMDTLLQDSAALGLPCTLIDPARVHRKQ